MEWFHLYMSDNCLIIQTRYNLLALFSFLLLSIVIAAFAILFSEAKGVKG